MATNSKSRAIGKARKGTAARSYEDAMEAHRKTPVHAFVPSSSPNTCKSCYNQEVHRLHKK